MNQHENELNIKPKSNPTKLASELKVLSDIERLREEANINAHGLEDSMPDSKLIHQIDSAIHEQKNQNFGED